MEEIPRVNLDFNAMWCHHHLQPLQAGWPTGGIQAMLGLFKAAVRSEVLAKEANRNAENLEVVLRMHAPICCFIEGERPGLPDLIIELALQGKVWGVD